MAIDIVSGATVIEVSVGAVAVTVRLTPGEVTPFTLALIDVIPTATPVANPRVPAVLLIDAKPAFDEVHVAVEVRFWVEPSLNVPVAVNCSVAPIEIDGAGFGVTAIEGRDRAVTVNPFVSEATSVPDVRVTVRAPRDADSAILTTAVALVAELTVSDATVIPAPKLAVVVACAKCVACPVIAIERFCWPCPPVLGLTRVNAGVPVLVIVSPVEPTTLPSVAEIVVDLPPVTPVASPVEVIVAATGVDEAQVTAPVTFWVLPFAKVATAVNCRVAFTAMEAFAGVTAMEAGAAATKTTEAGLYRTVQSSPAGRFGRFGVENWPVTDAALKIVN